jgi:hypothetical protein
MEQVGERRALTFKRVENWNSLQGAFTEIRRQGQSITAGIVDCVTPDGLILWVLPTAGSRKLFDQRESYEAWVEATPAYRHLWRDIRSQ